ncbi:esterase/lipase family protein [Parashewanella tropica]|uniref:esterase/lipase family protein n=1 Tax=Parashewanella tropica TaxID=2547970 RepID=UPI00105A4E23|nr:alpha/beta hydrolase [Parashewanella tropica]
MKKIPLAIFLLLFSTFSFANSCVILLHGLAKSERDMRKLDEALVKEGFVTVNFDYDSRNFPIETLSLNVVPSAIEQCPKGAKINFVTHSMGGIVVRTYLADHKIDNLGRVVMLGPPNQGSEVVDTYKNVPGFKQIGGPAGLQLGTGKMSVPNSIGAAEFDVGVIAGTRSINLILSKFLPGKDDGKVTVERTKLKGMNDHISMPVTHPFMMKNKKVIKQVIYYLKNGYFYRESK